MRRKRYKDPRLIVTLLLIPRVMPARSVPRFFMLMRRIKFFPRNKGAESLPVSPSLPPSRRVEHRENVNFKRNLFAPTTMGTAFFFAFCFRGFFITYTNRGFYHQIDSEIFASEFIISARVFF